MDITHRPRHVTCEVCCQKDSEEFMREFEGRVFVHDPECIDEYVKLLQKENSNGTNMVE